MPVQILQLTNDRLQPALYPSDARTSNGKFGASKVFPKGCVIGRKTSDGLLYPALSVNVVQNFTQTGTATAGTVTLTVPKPDGSFGTTTALAYNVSLATLQTALDVAIRRRQRRRGHLCRLRSPLQHPRGPHPHLLGHRLCLAQPTPRHRRHHQPHRHHRPHGRRRAAQPHPGHHAHHGGFGGPFRHRDHAPGRNRRLDGPAGLHCHDLRPPDRSGPGLRRCKRRGRDRRVRIHPVPDPVG
jgi:hypothetical protein